MYKRQCVLRSFLTTCVGRLINFNYKPGFASYFLSQRVFKYTRNMVWHMATECPVVTNKRDVYKRQLVTCVNFRWFCFRSFYLESSRSASFSRSFSLLSIHCMSARASRWRLRNQDLVYKHFGQQICWKRTWNVL